MSNQANNNSSGENSSSDMVRSRLAELFSIVEDKSEKETDLGALRDAVDERTAAAEEGEVGGDGLANAPAPTIGRLGWLADYLEDEKADRPSLELTENRKRTRLSPTESAADDEVNEETLSKLEAKEENDDETSNPLSSLLKGITSRRSADDTGNQASASSNQSDEEQPTRNSSGDDAGDNDPSAGIVVSGDSDDTLPADFDQSNDIEDTAQDTPLFGDGHATAPIMPGTEADFDDANDEAGISAQSTQVTSQNTELERVSDGGAGNAPSDRVTARLLKNSKVSFQQVNDAQQRLKKQYKKNGEREALWRVLADKEHVDEETREIIFAEAARLYAFPIADLSSGGPIPEFVKKVLSSVNEEYRNRLIQLGVAPFKTGADKKGGGANISFVTHDPARPELFHLMQKLKLDRFELMYAPEKIVSRALEDAFPKKNEYLERIEDSDVGMDLGVNFEDDQGLIDEDALEAEISRSALINLFEATLVEAVRDGASDIHIYPNPNKQVEIHFRTDGRLQHWYTEEKVHPEAILAVIKDNSMNVDRFERESAQDGFIQRRIDGALIRFRVSILPIANASSEIRSESIVIRVLDDRKVIKDLSKLGLLEGALERFDEAIRQPNGMVILTGPTGSGKSTTLVAALHQVVTPEVNVLTVEDPVEYIIDGVRQIKLNQKLALEDALRSILRHDPDVVMVGEMRDKSTAELAIKLANTGHLAFSTLHTNDAPSAVSRLYKMGIEPFLIAYAINLVVAQRLIRTLCPDCKQYDDDPDPVLLKRLGFSDNEVDSVDFYKEGQSDNCPTCHGIGYKGRRACSEALYFSREIRHMIVEAEGMINEGKIREQAESEGMLTLQASAREVVKMGETSVREMVRVVSTTE